MATDEHAECLWSGLLKSDETLSESAPWLLFLNTTFWGNVGHWFAAS